MTDARKQSRSEANQEMARDGADRKMLPEEIERAEGQ